MERVFSVEEISDQFWSPPPVVMKESSKMNRSESEWAFHRFLQEASAVASDSSPQSSSVSGEVKSNAVEVQDQNKGNVNDKTKTASSLCSSGTCPPLLNGAAAAPAVASPSIPMDSEDYQAVLKSKLNLACAAVALSRASFVIPKDSPAGADSRSQASNASKVESHTLTKGAVSGPQDKQKKSGDSVKPATSGSSRDQSEDDENEGETETTQNTDPADVKRVRRMLSNRESARRSRRRKQAHLTDLETQVSQLRVENSSLSKRLTDTSQKYNEAAVDNRVLKADVETLRAKVKMAEEMVKRITGLSPLFHALPEISTNSMSMPSYGSPSETSTDAAVSVHDDTKHAFYQPPNNLMPTHDMRANNCLEHLADNSSVENVQPNSGAAGNKMGRTASLQRVASLEHLQKRIRGGASPCGVQSTGEQ